MYVCIKQKSDQKQKEKYKNSDEKNKTLKKFEIYNIINHLELDSYSIPVVSNHQSINQVFAIFFVCE